MIISPPPITKQLKFHTRAKILPILAFLFMRNWQACNFRERCLMPNIKPSERVKKRYELDD